MRWTLFGWTAALILAAAAQAETAPARDGLAARLLTADEGRKLLKKIDDGMYDGSEVNARRAEVYAAMAVGDLTRARKALGDDNQKTVEADAVLAFDFAVAAGDAQLAELAKKRLPDATSEADARAFAAPKVVGRAAPRLTLNPRGGRKAVIPSRRGRVYVLDFWCTASAPTDEQVKALREMQAEFKDQLRVAFISVNSDLKDDFETAVEKAKTLGVSWPTHYDRRDADEKSTAETFGLPSVLAVVVIDSAGAVRCVALDVVPSVRYAVRAALAELEGDAEPTQPRDCDGAVFTPEAEQAKGRKGGAAKEDDDKGGKAQSDDLPSNAEASKLLATAHAFRKMRSYGRARELYEQIIREYPGTKEAAEAQEYLDRIPKR